MSRMVFVDRFTIRIMGEVIPHGQDGRQGYPIRSVYEKRKRVRGGRSDAQLWAAEFHQSHLSKKQAEVKAEDAAKQLKTKEKEIKVLRREAVILEAERTRVSTKLKEAGSEASSDTPTYVDLVQARKDLKDKRTELLTEEAELRQHRHNRYYWNKVAKAATSSGNVRTVQVSQAKDTIPTWNWPMAEDSTRRLDISKLLAAQSPNKVVVFAGTDYGLRRMSETVVQTYQEIQAHINRYWALYRKFIAIQREQ